MPKECEKKISMNNSIVSIVVPIYNIEKYINRCVQSLIHQTYEGLQIILVNDGSTDSSGQKCEELRKLDNRIEVYHKPNGGLSDARNYGMKKCHGEYLFFIDGDDYLPTSAIERLVRLIRETDSDIAIGNMVRTSRESDDYNHDERVQTRIMNSTEALIDMLYCDDFSTSACGKLVKKQLFDGIEFPLRKFSEDLFTIYKVILQSKRVSYINSTVYYYYYRMEGSLVVSDYSEKHIEAIEAVEQIESSVDLENNEMVRAIYTQYINVIFDIASRNPSVKQFQNNKIQNNLREKRMSVLLNNRAPSRLRLFSAATFFGNRFCLFLVKMYYRFKWTKGKNK